MDRMLYIMQIKQRERLSVLLYEDNIYCIKLQSSF